MHCEEQEYLPNMWLMPDYYIEERRSCEDSNRKNIYLEI
jgi:hypothetical protein